MGSKLYTSDEHHSDTQTVTFLYDAAGFVTDFDA